jgi:hypothetical protein
LFEILRSKLKRKSLALIVAAFLLLAGVSAQASGILNTPTGGYLICVNSKTKVVTHPGTSSCPKGSKKLVLGAQGLSGKDGKTLWNGIKDPENTVGVPGDMFINTTTKVLFGPKDGVTGWNTGVSLVGPQGPGGTGPAGPAGSNATLTCAQGGTCALGDTGPGGGIVFIVQTPVAEAPWRYMEAAPNTWSGGVADPSIRWCNITNAFVPNLLTGNTASIQTSTAIGAGYSNTQKMLRGCSYGAANAAASYNGGGKSDWHLPSKDELEQLYSQPPGVGGFRQSGYWSSSEDSASDAWAQGLGNGVQIGDGKSNSSTYVRPVRAF